MSEENGTVHVVYDHDAHNALLVDPGTPVELRRGTRRRYLALARVGLSVVAVSGLCLLPANSLAEDAPPAAAPIVVTADCDITGALAQDAPKSALPDGTPGPAFLKGTPSGTLADGSICVQPPAQPQPEQKPAEPDAPSAPADVSATPAADSPAGVAATDPAPQAQVEPKAQVQTSAGAKPAPLSHSAAHAPVHTSLHSATSQHTSRQARHSARTRRHTNLRTHIVAKPPVPLEAPLAGPEHPALYVSDEAVIPRFLLKLYKQAGRHNHVPWPILAAINEIETDFGRNVAVSSAGAVGWMQFMPATWAMYGVDADHNGTKDPRSPRDAIFAAARYLRASGARTNLRRAIFAYNHAGWYVDSVLLRANRIAAQEGVRDLRLTRLLEARTRRLERQVLTDPRITIYGCGRQDIAEHKIDRRVLIVLRFLAWSGLNPTVSALECGHSYYTASGNVSEHSSGNAVDITAINGVPILGNQGPGSIAEATIRELLTLRGAERPHQIISLMTFADADNTMALPDHANHIHVGFAPLKPIDPHGLVDVQEPTDSIAPPAASAPLTPDIALPGAVDPLALLAPALDAWQLNG
jgi:membrane-bound lytic murein transglycosylase B